MKSTRPAITRKTLGNTFLPPFLILAGVLLAAAGIRRGEVFFVFQKAVAVCLECMGIG